MTRGADISYTISFRPFAGQNAKVFGLLQVVLALSFSLGVTAQQSVNDTIRLGAITEHGKSFPLVFLPEHITSAPAFNDEARKERIRLRNNIYKVYPYALTAAAVLKDVHANLERTPDRKSRKKYLKEIDRQLDVTFTAPLKNMSIDQGHVLIKLINRQTGQNCYSIIRELKNGFSAVLWQSVGVLFNNNLRHNYDPTGEDAEIENIVRDMEASAAYRYQLYQQEELMKKLARP
jgi:hypothetical protein